MEQDEVPRQVQPVLQLAEPDLDEQHREQGKRRPKERWGALSTSGQVAEQEEKGATEDRDDAGMREHDRLQPRQAVDLGCAATRMRPGRGRERAADDERQSRHGEAEPRFLEAIGSSVEVTEFRPLSFTSNETDVVATVRWAYKVKATGKSAAMYMQHWWRFADGKIVFFRGSEDTEQSAAAFA